MWIWLMPLSHDLLLQASPGEMESELANGLIIGHAYSITSVKMVRTRLKPLSQTPSVSLPFVASMISCDFVYMYSNIHVLFHRLVAPSLSDSHLESSEGCGEMGCSFPPSSHQSPPVPFSTMFSHSWLVISSVLNKSTPSCLFWLKSLYSRTASDLVYGQVNSGSCDHDTSYIHSFICSW